MTSFPSPERPLSPDAAALADEAAAWRSAYVHIPFCRRRCPYCDFAVVAADEGGSDALIDRYLRAVHAEIDMEPDWAPLDAVNFGGGTPSSIDPGSLAATLSRIETRFGFEAGAEISIEANPEDWTPELGDALVGKGFNRVSLGVQSFDEAVLGALGRLHRPDQAAAAVQAARASGFRSVSLDLIYGTPGETTTSWRTTVERAIDLAPDHLSAYSLTVERGTALSRAVLEGAPAPDPDVQADRYEYLLEAAAAAGLVRYEVSNFARPGHHCRYNLSTWAQGEYIAFGLGAHGHRDGLRRRNIRRLDAYLASAEHGDRPEAGAERLDPWAREQERVMLGLRRVAGVRTGAAGEALLASATGRRLLDAGVIGVDGGRIVVRRPLLTDEAVREVLST